jgi:hypothetical protein
VATFHDGRFSRVSAIGPRGGIALASDSDSLWIGGYGGLKHFRNGVLIKTYTTADGLSGDPIRHLLIDKDHALWIATPKGLDRLADGKMRSYSVKDGLPDNDVTALRLIADDTLLVKTQNSAFVRLVHDHFENWHIPGVADNNINDVGPRWKHLARKRHRRTHARQWNASQPLYGDRWADQQCRGRAVRRP